MKLRFMPPVRTALTDAKTSAFEDATRDMRTTSTTPVPWSPGGVSDGEQMCARSSFTSEPLPTQNLASLGAPAGKNPNIETIYSVQSPADYVNAMKVHVQRVGVLAQELLKRHADEFPGVEAKTLADFAAVHDAAKVETSDEFLKHHRLERPLADDLAVEWGRLLKTAPNTPNRLIEKLNQVDHAVEAAFFSNRGIGSALAASYKLLVEVADKVDRGMASLSRYEEMGKTAKPVGEYLRHSKDTRDQLIARLAQGLEADYEKIVPETMNYFDLYKTS